LEVSFAAVSTLPTTETVEGGLKGALSGLLGNTAGAGLAPEGLSSNPGIATGSGGGVLLNGVKTCSALGNTNDGIIDPKPSSTGLDVFGDLAAGTPLDLPACGRVGS
jgi:hypothetical protein